MSDPYRTAAVHYPAGRPPYSASLVPAVVAALGLDGTGALLDVGCGPGVLARAFAPHVGSVVGLDPSASMLAVARDLAPGVRWVLGRAEDVPALAPGPYRLVTFGQSYHWTDRARVASLVHDVLLPGGAMLVINHVPSASPPAGPGLPPIPHDAIDDLLDRFPGVGTRRGGALTRHEEVLAASPFGPPSRLVLPGRDDLVRTPDDILANLYSTSFASPERFGDQREAFEADLRALLGDRSYWEFPGDTEVLVSVRPRPSG